MTNHTADPPRPARDNRRQWIEANQHLAIQQRYNDNAEFPTYSACSDRSLRELCSMGSHDDSTVSQNFTLAGAGGCDKQDEGGRGRGGAAATQPRVWPRKI